MRCPIVLLTLAGCGPEASPAPEPCDRVVSYLDADHDGWGELSSARTDCGVQGDDRVTQAGDCDDTNPAVHPAAVEICDGADDDCDGTADDGLVASTWYQDGDGDGVGDSASATSACAAPGADWVEADGDCDDAAAAAYPGAPEVCDGIDDDCDGLVDDDDPDLDDATRVDGYPDDDGDGFGSDAALVRSCTIPAGWLTVGGDCDDADPDVNPDAPEVCGGVDDDCDGQVDLDDPDVDPTPIPTWRDLDGDGFGAGSPVQACTPPVGWVAAGDDCDDGDPDAWPDAPETCSDGVDQDCDGSDDLCTIFEVTYPVGSSDDVFHGPGRYRGNLFVAATDGELSKFRMYLDLPASCSIDWYVHEGPAITGPYVPLFAAQTVAGPGFALYESPPIDVPTTAGLYYGVGVGFTCDVTYFRDNDTYWVGVDIGIGTFDTGLVDDAYPGFSATYFPPHYTYDLMAYHQEIVMWE